MNTMFVPRGLPDCSRCHGSGTLYDWVPYGNGDVRMAIDCYCVAEQIDAFQDELDALGEQENPTPEQTARYAKLRASLC